MGLTGIGTNYPEPEVTLNLRLTGEKEFYDWLQVKYTSLYSLYKWVIDEILNDFSARAQGAAPRFTGALAGSLRKYATHNNPKTGWVGKMVQSKNPYGVYVEFGTMRKILPVVEGKKKTKGQIRSERKGMRQPPPYMSGPFRMWALSKGLIPAQIAYAIAGRGDKRAGLMGTRPHPFFLRTWYQMMRRVRIQLAAVLTDYVRQWNRETATNNSTGSGSS